VEAKQYLQHLQKPFIKLQSLAVHGQGSGLTPDEVSRLNQYIGDPFEALVSEDSGYPLLKRVLQKLDSAMSEEKLTLKPEKTRKARQLISEILDKDSLSQLYARGTALAVRRRKLLESPQKAEAEKQLKKLSSNVDECETRKRVVEGEIFKLGQTNSEALQRIVNYRSEIEKNVQTFLNKTVKIE